MYQTPATMSPSIPPSIASQLFLRNLTPAVEASQGYCESHSKRHLWMSMLCMVVNHPEYRRCATCLSFVSYEPRVVLCDHGLMIVTVSDHQVNVNLIVPARADSVAPLREHMLEHVRTTWSDHAINLAPLARFTDDPPEPTYQPRRLVPSRRFVRVVQYVDGMVECLGDRVAPHRVLDDPRDVGAFTPLARMERSDPTSTVYWHRFSCGTIVAFHNPTMPIHPHLDLPPQIENGVVVSTLLTPCCRKYVSALSNPNCLQQCLDLMEEEWIPLPQRRFLAITTKAHFGLSDILIFATGKFLGCEMLRQTIVTEMCLVYESVCDMLSHKPVHRIAETMFDAIAVFKDQTAWRRWMIHSEIVYALVDKVSADHLDRMCRRYNYLYYVVAVFLIHNRDEWTHEERRKAYLIASSDMPVSERVDTDPIDILRRVMDELQHETTERGGALIAQERRTASATAPSRAPSRPGRRTVVVGRPIVTDDVVASPSSPTMRPLVAAFRRDVLGDAFECTLIGSGIFHSDTDADVAIAVPGRATLQEAYRDVWALLTSRCPEGAWTAQYDEVTDEHVAVVRGAFGGRPFDLQIWRGARDATTLAEDRTRRAIRLSATLSEGTTEEHRRHVAALHGFATEASWKGHRLCRLPGVAVTCLAIAVGRGGAALTTRALLERVRHAVAQEVPVVDFDALEYVTSSLERPSAALSVLVDEVNVVTRLTTATTRHLSDTLAFALTHERGPLPSRADYDAWRARTMLRALSVRPRDASRSVSLTLHASIARLDGHPLVDTVYVEESREDDGTLHVLVTLVSTADASIYGLRPTDELGVDATHPTLATVRRRGRSWLLCTKEETNAHTLDEGVSSVTQMVRIPGSTLCVPNAPHLRMDVLKCFDVQHWTVVA